MGRGRGATGRPRSRVVPLVAAPMSRNDVTRALDAIGRGDPRAAGDLLPLVYDELRDLAAARLAREAPGHTLQATALVHEAYLRLVGPGGRDDDDRWDGRGHFFAAAAEAMRRVLVESARRKRREKHGGGRDRVPLPDDLPAGPDAAADELLAVDGVVDDLAAHDPAAAELVKLHVFAGQTIERAAELLGVSPRTAHRTWAYARAWMFRRLAGPPG